MTVDNIKKILHPQERVACVTLDFESDYGGRANQFSILDLKDEIDGLAGMFKRLNVPLTAFIQTDLLDNYASSKEAIEKLAVDFHCHSHTHNFRDFNSREEIAKTAEAFKRHFGFQALGYRAPQGMLYDGDIELCRENGFKLCSSVFPSFRPGRFNNLEAPTSPFYYENGIMELPFACVDKVRTVISLSYLKLMGLTFNKLLFRSFGLPNVLIFDSHLHDYIVHPDSFSKLPPAIRAAYSVNKRAGRHHAESFIEFLRARNYRFLTITELYEHLANNYPLI